MNQLRKHADLHTLLVKEVAGILNPRQSAEAIKKKTPGAFAHVLYIDKAGNWVVMAVGHGQAFPSIGVASRSWVSGKSPVAVAYV